MRNNRHRNGKPRFFEELIPLADAIAMLPPSKARDSRHDHREAEIAAQRKRQRKQAARLKREGRSNAP